MLCNSEIKFKAFLDHALRLGADKIATGHYAQVREFLGEWQLMKAEDGTKDQSYFLYRLNQAQLSKTLFPVGHLYKRDVRKIAEEAGLPNHAKKDSTGICFIGERPFREFLARYLPKQPGEIRRLDDERVIGKHEGLMYYTLGQREGLGIGGVKDAPEEPWFVCAKDMAKNVLYVVQGHDHPALLKRPAERRPSCRGCRAGRRTPTGSMPPRRATASPTRPARSSASMRTNAKSPSPRRSGR